MRTTLTIDEEFLRRIKTEAARSGQSFMDIANENLERGIKAATAIPQRFQTEPAHLGTPDTAVDLIKPLVLAEKLEDAEILTKLEHR